MGPAGDALPRPMSWRVPLLAAWPRDSANRPFVVCTGGEPLLQLDEPLLDALHRAGFEIAVETNGTQRYRPASTGCA